MSDDIKIIDIGEPDLPEMTVKDADTTTPVEQERELSTKYNGESLAKGVVGAISMITIGASKAMGCDLALTEDEAVELQSAVSDYAATFDNADLPPWAVLLMVTGGLVANKYMVYLMHIDKQAQIEVSDNVENISN